MSSLPLAYLHSPDRGVWMIGPVPIRAYALCIIAGIVVAVLWGEKRFDARGGEPGTVTDVAVFAVPFGLVGGRLYHVLTDWKTYFGPGADPVDALKIWHGGLGIWGAISLGAVGAWIGCRRRGVPLTFFADAVAPGIVTAQAIGRLGNWFNQELYGGPTTLPWGLEIYRRIDPATGFTDPLAGVAVDRTPIAVVQPTFLYELLWNLVVAGLVVWADRRFRLGHGRAFALYVAGYTLGRFFIELLRTDPATRVFGDIRINVVVAAVVFLGAVAYLVKERRPREEPPFPWQQRDTDPALDPTAETTGDEVRAGLEPDSAEPAHEMAGSAAAWAGSAARRSGSNAGAAPAARATTNAAPPPAPPLRRRVVPGPPNDDDATMTTEIPLPPVRPSAPEVRARPAVGPPTGDRAVPTDHPSSSPDRDAADETSELAVHPAVGRDGDGFDWTAVPAVDPADRTVDPVEPVERAAEPVVEPAGRAVDPVVAPAARVADPVVAPAARVADPVAEPAGRVTDPVVEPAGRAAEPAVDRTSDPAVEPATDHDVERPAAPVVDPTAERTPAPLTPEPVTPDHAAARAGADRADGHDAPHTDADDATVGAALDDATVGAALDDADPVTDHVSAADPAIDHGGEPAADPAGDQDDHATHPAPDVAAEPATPHTNGATPNGRPTADTREPVAADAASRSGTGSPAAEDGPEPPPDRAR